jgi:hypothetical protein
LLRGGWGWGCIIVVIIVKDEGWHVD